MICLRTLLPFIISLFMVQSVDCQSWKWDVDNNVEFRNFQFYKIGNELASTLELKSDHNLELRYKTNLVSSISLKGIYNTVNKERTRFFLNEANIALNKGRFNLKIGKQIVKYGGLAGLSNLDLANSYDYYDLLLTDEEELGQWAISSKIDIGEMQLSVSYMDDLRSSKVYITDSPWINLPNEMSHPLQEGAMIPLAFREFSFVDNHLSKRAFSIGLNMDVFGLNTRLDFYKGFNDIPFSTINIDFTAQNIPFDYDLELSIQPLTVYNINIQKLYGDWNVWAEYGYIKNHYTNAEGISVPDNYSLVSLGFDRFFLFEDPSKTLKLLTQWRHAVWHSGFEYRATDLDHVLDRSIIIDLDFQQSYDLSFGLRTAMSYDGYGLYLSPSVAYKFGQKVTTTIGYDYLAGSNSHFFGHFKNNDRFLLKLKLAL